MNDARLEGMAFEGYFHALLTKATTHKCDAGILWKLAQPFVNVGLRVYYIALLDEKDNKGKFRLNPAVIKVPPGSQNIPLYVAHFEVTSLGSEEGRP
ncbi:hypothetical protein BBJ29_009815 [Phytophthora kernoviae]|uniref:Uncharacterized protein n=1 Tax=Phytophthora kernoviae TaxID=325452 RepID=A0A3F2RDW0_9STRA|nr:hypothetical protein BBP00_00008993 [Phytophthora kernoviae]RLN56600.1 hypothetical protein BBJ29_009815 [Phytophthora kernoviae]